MEFARASVALPDDADGERWRGSVVPIISLHALTMALAELELLDAADRPFARDRASVMIADANTALRAAWRGEPMPESILVLREDAQRALEIARFVGATELRWAGDGILDMPVVTTPTPSPSTLCIAAPGTPMMPGSPVAWWIGGAPIEIEGCVAERVTIPRQVYRVLDANGRAVRDLIAPLTAELPAGLPLLMPLLEDGEPVGRMPNDVEAWRAMQRAALPEGGVRVETSG